MSVKFNQAFRKQAIEKALMRSSGVSIEDVASSIGVSRSTLQRWIKEANQQPLDKNRVLEEKMSQEKRPQDWSLEERLEMVIACGSLDEEAISERCREKGIYPHHVQQWKQDFATGKIADNKIPSSSDVKELKNENKELRKELNRKEKALAETAALLVLQKKVNAIWGNGEEN